MARRQQVSDLQIRLCAMVEWTAVGRRRLFSDNPAHPSLQFKPVHTTDPIFSARITLHYRALARRRDNDWIWVWIGSHADYDQLLKRL